MWYTHTPHSSSSPPIIYPTNNTKKHQYSIPPRISPKLHNNTIYKNNLEMAAWYKVMTSASRFFWNEPRIFFMVFYTSRTRVSFPPLHAHLPPSPPITLPLVHTSPLLLLTTWEREGVVRVSLSSDQLMFQPSFSMHTTLNKYPHPSPPSPTPLSPSPILVFSFLFSDHQTSPSRPTPLSFLSYIFPIVSLLPNLSPYLISHSFASCHFVSGSKDVPPFFFSQIILTTNNNKLSPVASDQQQESLIPYLYQIKK